VPDPADIPSAAAALPRISVIIPSLNQGEFIETTLRSVIDQEYSNLELIVMDGGSKDRTPEILSRYAPQITFLESTEDRGQSHAINKGLARATGDIWCYLNSDDLLAPGSLARIGALFRDPAVDWVGGISVIFDERGDCGTVTPQEPKSQKEILTPWKRSVEHVFPCSNVCFMRRSIYEKLGGFDESYGYSMDMEYYTRAHFAGFRLLRIPDVLGRWRWHPASKTVKDGSAYRFLEEELRIAVAYADRLASPDREELKREIVQHRKSFLVRRALHSPSEKSRSTRLCRLFFEAIRHPSLIWFRPWLGAVKQQVVPS
jgi:glycosyltransferase involved in cell wall biosynthesis